MAGSFHLDVAGRRVFSRGWGELTDADLLGHVRALAAHPDFVPDFEQCVDYLGVERVALTSEAVRHAAEENPFLPGARRVFVLNRQVMAGLVRMYELSGVTSTGSILIVATLAEALRALGLDPAFAWPTSPPDWSSGDR